MTSKNIRQYVELLEPLMDDLGQVAGKPHRIKVVGDYVYWTQGKSQELFRAPVANISAKAVERVIKTADSAASSTGDKKYTKEEELLRERMRSLVTGITSYEVRERDGAVFYTAGLDLYVYYTHSAVGPLKVFSYLKKEDKEHFEKMGSRPNMCVQFISDGDESKSFTTVTFVNNSNIYIAFLTEHGADSGKEPLSVEIKQVTTIGDELRLCGLADYIIQEEFDRFSGHVANQSHVLFTYTNSSMMRQVSLLQGGGPADSNDEGDGVERMPYSRVGDPNALTSIAVYERKTGSFRLVPPTAFGAVAPWGVEYITRFGFKNVDTIYLLLLSRTQEEAVVVSCPIASLPIVTEHDIQNLYIPGSAPPASVQGATIPFTVEWKQHIPWAWVETMPGAPIHFTPTHDVVLAAAVETNTAHYHVYVRRSGEGCNAWKPLTSGAWSVRWGSVKVQKDVVTFVANAEDRLSSVLYSVPLPKADAEAVAVGASELSRLSPKGEHVYPASYCMHGGHLYYVSSQLAQPAQLWACSLGKANDSSPVSLVEASAWMRSASGSEAPKLTAIPAGPRTVNHLGHNLCLPEVITVTSRRGVPLSAHFFSTQKTGTKQPLAVFVYGGPHVQLVWANDYDTVCRMSVQALVAEGFAVAVVDNQMSNANGLRDQSVCKKKMGSFETDDYVDVVKYICSHSIGGAVVDPSRVAIFGWSYGGYATLLAMCQAPDTFKMGFAGAPVGDWKLYDTGYTERYMGLLHADAEKKTVSKAYEESTIAHLAKGFPDDINRVYIAHGLLDENVHFGHTCHVVEAMIAEGKPYSMLVYPGERHGLRQKKRSRLHFEAMLLKTFSAQLL